MDTVLNYLITYAPAIGMAFIFYFLVYRPGKNEESRRKKMLSGLHKGNRVVTIGGIFGEIQDIKDNVISLKIADKVIIQVSRAAIQKNLSQGKEELGMNDELRLNEKEAGLDE